jgi:hypothetical protein
MGDSEHKIDAEIVEDLLCVERCSTFLGAGPLRPEFWEVFTLLKSNRDHVLGEVKRLTELRASGQPATISLDLHEKLLDIRREFYGLASDLRPFLSKHEGMRDGMRLELALVFIMGSRRARDAAVKWIADPAAHAVEASVRVRLMGRLADAYCRALLEARKASPAAPPSSTYASEVTVIRHAPGPAASPPPPAFAPPFPPAPEPDIILRPQEAPPPAPLPPAPPPPAPAPKVQAETRVTARLHPQFIEDYELVQRIRRLLEGPRPPPPPWEIHALVSFRRAEIPAYLDDLERLRRSGKPGEFAGASYALREKIREAMSKYEALAGSLRGYLEKVMSGWKGEAEEIAMAILLGSSHGRHRAKQWLDDPDVCRNEAASLMKSLLDRARELVKGRGVAAGM